MSLNETPTLKNLYIRKLRNKMDNFKDYSLPKVHSSKVRESKQKNRVPNKCLLFLFNVKGGYKDYVYS